MDEIWKFIVRTLFPNARYQHSSPIRWSLEAVDHHSTYYSYSGGGICAGIYSDGHPL